MSNKIVLNPTQSQEYYCRWLDNTLQWEMQKSVLDAVAALSGKYSFSAPSEQELWLSKEQYQWLQANKISIEIKVFDGQVTLMFEDAQPATEFALCWL